MTANTPAAGNPRRPMVAGNWKLHKTLSESTALAEGLVGALPAGVEGPEVVVAPVFTALAGVAERLAGSTIELAAQTLHWETEGAYTGEVGPLQLTDLGCGLVIIGHSERRQFFGETDAVVSKKVNTALAHGLRPIVCVGESLETREAGQAEAHVLGQVSAALAGLSSEQLAQAVVAYEPIWAIGTGRTASPADAQQMHAAIRGRVASEHGTSVAEGLRILYGGSVKPNNAAELLAEPDIDGALVGGASLKVDSFAAIVAAAG